MLRPHIIRQPQVFPNANEKPRTEIAQRFLQKFQRVPSGIVNAHAGESDHNDPLLFVPEFGHTYNFGWMQRFARLDLYRRRALPVAELRVYRLLDPRARDVTKNGKHAIVWNGQAMVKLQEMRAIGGAHA